MKTLIYISTFLLILANPVEPYYCKCESNETLEDELNTSDLIMIGTVMGKRVISKHLKDDHGVKTRILLVSYQIRVQKSYKGIGKDRVINLYTNYDNASCGSELESGKRYIIFGKKGPSYPPKLVNQLSDREKRSYWTNQCTRTGIYSSELEDEIEQIVYQ